MVKIRLKTNDSISYLLHIWQSESWTQASSDTTRPRNGERWLSRLERKTLDRGVMGSNPPTVLRNLGKLSSTFEKDASMSQTKRRFFYENDEKIIREIITDPGLFCVSSYLGFVGSVL